MNGVNRFVFYMFLSGNWLCLFGGCLVEDYGSFVGRCIVKRKVFRENNCCWNWVFDLYG